MYTYPVSQEAFGILANSTAPDPAPPPIKIECVSTCVNYADFLAHTLPMNKHQFDKITIVTAPEDKQTIKVCDTYGVTCHRTDAFQTRWGQFCKGMAINEGLTTLDKDAWIVHMDSDIILPAHFRDTLARASLDPTMIYGCDRMEVQSYEDWQRFFGSPEPPIQGNGIFIHTTHAPFRFGTRVQFKKSGGWIPIGFFQLWHRESGELMYPEGHTNAAREDSLFPQRWPRSKRGFLPEIIVYHLESEQAPMAVNWNGRKTKTFSVDGESR
jgi:hypothetical protein